MFFLLDHESHPHQKVNEQTILRSKIPNKIQEPIMLMKAKSKVDHRSIGSGLNILDGLVIEIAEEEFVENTRL